VRPSTQAAPREPAGATAAGLDYAAVTPARNERDNLPRLAAALVAQQRRPREWVVVDDGSDDGGREAIEALAAEHDWIRVVDFEAAGGGALADGRREGRDLEAFRTGVRALRGEPEVVVKVDADVSFEPDYFALLLERFAAEPDLGIASGACWELQDGRWVRRRVMADHPRGATRAYRRECLPELMALEPRMGWDGVDEIAVSVRGYRSRTFTEIPFRHHRAEGGRERGRFQARAAQGRGSWYMGYRPGYVLLRTAYQLRTGPSALGIAWGYAASALRGESRCPDPEIRRRVRERQRLRSALRRGAPP